MKIVVDDLTFRYSADVTALKRVNLVIDSGESVAILGENGAGKSTLAKHLNGLLKPTEGRVSIGGWDTTEKSPAELARRVTYTFQNPDDQLFERTVRKEVSFGPKNLGLSSEALKDRVDWALDLTGLSSQADTHPYDLHATERKFVAIAASLAMQTPIVVIDEPTTGQDASGIVRLVRILDHLKDAGRTIITISHDIDFCAEQFQRAILMAGGQILADRPMAAAFDNEEFIQQAAIEPPQLIQLASALGWRQQPLTLDSFLNAYRQNNNQEGG